MYIGSNHYGFFSECKNINLLYLPIIVLYSITRCKTLIIAIFILFCIANYKYNE